MEKSLSDLKRFIDLTESKREKLVLEPLPYDKAGLAPVMSQETIDYQYGKLAKGYVDRYNRSEGDDGFNQAGAFLHNIYFNQFREPKNNNNPTGPILDFIEKHFKSWDKFKERFEEVAMTIQGSGWCFIDKKGKIKIIQNHEIRQDIIILIDFWEHAYNLDFRENKKKYLEKQWKIINWDKINEKL
jgi:Fe-Mn family superoxide dismutase